MRRFRVGQHLLNERRWLVSGFILCALCSSVVKADLVGYWNFDEVSGQAVLDSSAFGNDGNLGGNANAEVSADPVRVSGFLGSGALQFDGDLDRVTIPDSPSLSVTGDLTLSAWINVAPGSTNPRNILAKDANFAYRWRVDGGNDQLWMLLNDGPSLQVLTSGFNVSSDAGTWRHTAIRYTASELKVRFYYDGLLVSTRDTTKGSIADTVGALTIGSYTSGGAESWNGMLDDVAIWDEALPEFQIAQLASGLTPLQIPEPSTWVLVSFGVIVLRLRGRSASRFE